MRKDDDQAEQRGTGGEARIGFVFQSDFLTGWTDAIQAAAAAADAEAEKWKHDQPDLAAAVECRRSAKRLARTIRGLLPPREF